MYPTSLLQLALKEGADVAGIAPAVLHDEHYTRYSQYLARGDHGFLAWLNRAPRQRQDARVVLPEARSVLMIGVSCKHEASVGDTPIRIARYAQGRDYHRVLKRLLIRIARGIESQVEGLLWRACVDTAPLLERAFAWRAGLGWIGKNAMLIHPEYGSWLMLGALVVNHDFAPSTPVHERCGDCKRCLEACPSGALYAPRAVDASRCNSALTIELRARTGEPPPEFTVRQKRHLPPWLFGCDACQDACPWNQHARSSRSTLLTPSEDLIRRLQQANWPQVDDADSMNEVYESISLGRVIRRMTAEMFARNLRVLQEDPSDSQGRLLEP